METKLMLNYGGWQDHQIAIGIEKNWFDSGRKNFAGNNFIINEQIQSWGLSADGSGGFVASGDPNTTNAWVLPHQFNTSGIFVEDYYSLSDDFDIFAGLRFDDHPDWGNQLSPRLGMIYRWQHMHQLRLSWQSGFRGAVGVQFSGGFVQDGLLSQQNFGAVNNIAETLADFDFDGDATNDTKTLNNVEPETLSSFEIAYRWTPENFEWNSVLFVNEVKDILVAQAHGYVGLEFGDQVGSDAVGTWNGNWYFQNQSGRLRHWGIESNAKWQRGSWILAASHSLVRLLSADQGVIGSYVLPGNKIAAYPENITRLNTVYQQSFESFDLGWRSNLIYFWDYHAPTGALVSGYPVINMGVDFKSKHNSSFELSLIVKNILNRDGLYPINGTGDLSGADGTPATEHRSWWLNLSYQF